MMLCASSNFCLILKIKIIHHFILILKSQCEFLKKKIKAKTYNEAEVQKLNSCVFRKRDKTLEIVNTERELGLAPASIIFGFVKVGNSNELKSKKAKNNIHPGCLTVLC